jgi:hypothetical protein
MCFEILREKVMEKKLNEIKKMGNYAITLWFGEDIGCDDLDVPDEERSLQCTFVPAGYLGSVKILWKGKVKDFKEFDFSLKPTAISNPPARGEFDDPGLYIWGVENSVQEYISKHCA